VFTLTKMHKQLVQGAGEPSIVAGKQLGEQPAGAQ